MQRLVTGFIAGLSLVGGLMVVALVWPVAQSYLRPLATLGDPIIERSFDRSGLRAELTAKGVALGDEAYLRIFKREHRLELWMNGRAGRFVLAKTYEICKWSGTLGPKLAEGDRQAPEGFYRVALKQLNPNSRHHLAFNLGFPNALDQALGRTGSFLMVHGGCSSIGCYAMGDEQVDEIYAVVEAALKAGQREIDVSIFPFALTETALQEEAANPWAPFWQNLKQGFELFETDGVPPKVAVCDGRYVFGGDAVGPGCIPISGWA